MSTNKESLTLRRDKDIIYRVGYLHDAFEQTDSNKLVPVVLVILLVVVLLRKHIPTA